MRRRRAGASVPGPDRLAALAVAALIWLPCPSGSSESAPYLEALQARAEALELPDARRWRALIHYAGNRLGPGVTSYVDDPDFFLAAEGKTDPGAELVATLRAFFEPEPGAEAQHPQCAFPARYRWLREQLDFDTARLPERDCPRYRQLRDLIQPTGATLVFPEAFMNNPASMFGHTLLRIDVTESAAERDLLAWAVDFAASTGSEGGALFAIKGMIGAYPGYFSIYPYYEKVKQYGDWENRDIWEYRLDLDPDEIDWMLRHLWELQGIHFDYFYFQENCSFHLLGLLEVARPELELGADTHRLRVIPADTVRAVVRQAGLVDEVVFRPSATTRLRARHRQLSRELQHWVRALAEGRRDADDPDFAALSEDDRASALSLAYDLLRHRFLAGDVSREASAARSRRLLIARSRIDAESSTLAEVPVPALSPDQGHSSARFALGAGWSGDRPFVEARLRPSLHRLIDPQGGYVTGAQIQLGEFALRYYPEQNRLRLYEALLLDIVSLAPRDRLFKPLSWKLATGLRTRLVQNGGHLAERPVWRGEAGVGLTYELHPQWLAYGFAEAVIDAGRNLEESYALGPGASAGFLVGSPDDRWRADLSARAILFPLGDTTTSIRVGLDQRLSLFGPLALEVDAGYRRAYGDDWFEAAASFQFYF